jgi:acetolactate synthase-1/2/3 large subunit
MVTLPEVMSEKGPALVNICVDHTHNVLPMVPPGAANLQMIGG